MTESKNKGLIKENSFNNKKQRANEFNKFWMLKRPNAYTANKYLKSEFSKEYKMAQNSNPINFYLNSELNNQDEKWRNRSKIIEELENFQPIPTKELEEKLDYFYSPYNNSFRVKNIN